VAEHAERGVDVLKVMASGGLLTPGTDPLGVQFTASDLRILVEAGHDAGLRVLAHCHSEAGARHAVAAGVDGLEHFTSLTEQGPSTAGDLIAAIADAGITVDPTFGYDAARQLPLEQAPPGVREMAERTGFTIAQAQTKRATQMALVREHGIRVVSGLDAGAAPVKPHGDVWRSIVQLLDAGYAPAEALATATSVAADDCGLAGTTGRLAASYDADVLVVDGDLETDVAALSRPVRVLVRGVDPAAD
jgi:imidazolonepropionase-like amidohydrolase